MKYHSQYILYLVVIVLSFRHNLECKHFWLTWGRCEACEFKFLGAQLEIVPISSVKQMASQTQCLQGLMNRGWHPLYWVLLTAIFHWIIRWVWGEVMSGTSGFVSLGMATIVQDWSYLRLGLQIYGIKWILSEVFVTGSGSVNPTTPPS